jgi:hypothetical protein
VAPTLEEVVLADDPAVWEELGFVVVDGVVWLGGVALRLAGRAAGEGIVDWTVGDGRTGSRAVSHPNGAIALDCVVLFTGDLERTTSELEARGLELRRMREAGGQVRQAFYNLRTALLEVVGPRPGSAVCPAEEDEPRFWGLVVVVEDIDALSERLAERLGRIKDAVQPGRRIGTLRREAGSSTEVAFMTPR